MFPWSWYFGNYIDAKKNWDDEHCSSLWFQHFVLSKSTHLVAIRHAEALLCPPVSIYAILRSKEMKRKKVGTTGMKHQSHAKAARFEVHEFVREKQSTEAQCATAARHNKEQTICARNTEERTIRTLIMSSTTASQHNFSPSERHIPENGENSTNTFRGARRRLGHGEGSSLWSLQIIAWPVQGSNSRCEAPLD